MTFALTCVLYFILVHMQAFKMAKNEKYRAGQFKAGNHWCQQFMKRNGLSLWQKTTLAKRLPVDYEEKIVQFHRFVINLRKEHNYPLHIIAYMDETPLTLDMPLKRTIHNIGEKTKKFQQRAAGCCPIPVVCGVKRLCKTKLAKAALSLIGNMGAFYSSVKERFIPRLCSRTTLPPVLDDIKAKDDWGHSSGLLQQRKGWSMLFWKRAPHLPYTDSDLGKPGCP